ncbi:MAG: response regulator transcription factor [Candidatus Glassbacteria bacterium]|nr:response regulator transcription factor [Candidatus Glassbacteria bacterium]
MIRILIADDHPIVRKGLREILTETKDVFDVHEAENGPDVLDRLDGGKYDVLVLDISMPGLSGLDVLKQVKKRNKSIPVLILSRHPEQQYAVRSIRAGADGYLTKESAPQELSNAIQKVARGGKYVSSSMADQLVDYLKDDSSKRPHEKLSDREFQVMQMIATGKTVGEIAGEMSLSVNTISTYRMRVLEKMNLENNAQIMYYAMKEGLIN